MHQKNKRVLCNTSTCLATLTNQVLLYLVHNVYFSKYNGTLYWSLENIACFILCCIIHSVFCFFSGLVCCYLSAYLNTVLRCFGLGAKCKFGELVCGSCQTDLETFRSFQYVRTWQICDSTDSVKSGTACKIQVMAVKSAKSKGAGEGGLTKNKMMAPQEQPGVLSVLRQSARVGRELPAQRTAGMMAATLFPTSPLIVCEGCLSCGPIPLWWGPGLLDRQLLQPVSGEERGHEVWGEGGGWHCTLPEKWLPGSVLCPWNQGVAPVN